MAAECLPDMIAHRVYEIGEYVGLGVILIVVGGAVSLTDRNLRVGASLSARRRQAAGRLT